MGRSIPVSEKYGVNPSMGVCFWCGQDDGTILLLGRLPGDAEAPRRITAGYGPCAACKVEFAKGVTLLEVTEHGLHEHQQPITRDPDLFPTGRLLVIRDEAVERIFQPASMVADVLRRRQAFIEPEVFAKLYPPPEVPSAEA